MIIYKYIFITIYYFHPYNYSDIDLAIEGADDFDRLFAELKYNEFTLLDMDIINLNDRVSELLMKDISHDGYILYEKGQEHEPEN